jgi:hypothetical protein
MKRRSVTQGWTQVRCPVPADIAHVDSFLTVLLAPTMNAMVDAAELASWYFERTEPGWIRLHAWDVERPLLVARLSGLTYAADHAAREPAAPGTVRQYEAVMVEEPGTGDWGSFDPALAARCAQVALEVLAAKPVRASRMRAAIDLAIAVSVDLRREPRTGFDDTWHRGAGWPEGGSREPSERHRAGQGAATRWVGCLAGIGVPVRTLRALLHNQIGLRVDDSRLLHGALLMSPRPLHRLRDVPTGRPTTSRTSCGHHRRGAA